MLKLLLVTILVVINLTVCTRFNGKSISEIEGLWISTEESSSKFLSGTQEVVLQIKRENTEGLAVRGIFLWNGDYQSEWKLVDIQYDSITQHLTILDADADTFKCNWDFSNDRLTGAVHLQNKSTDPLSFRRADKNLFIKLFQPRIPDRNGNISYAYTIPKQLDDGLQTTSIYNAGIDSMAVNLLIKDIINQKYGRIESLLILKDDKLIVEEYFYGYDRTSLHKIHSCTKSVTSLLLGIALEHHNDIELKQPIFSFFPKYDFLKSEGREKITLENVLTMTAGLEWDEFPKEMYETDDCIHYILSRPMKSQSGDKFHYNSGCSILLGSVIQFLEGRNVLVFAEEFLFTPLGITNYTWDTLNDGTLQCGGGLSLCPRDMAKIGLFVLNDGKWQDKQIVSKEWIRESTTPHVQESKFFDYGYQWWHRSSKNLQWWKEPNVASLKEHALFNAKGWGGQFIMVIRDLNMVVVLTASNFEKELYTYPMVIEEIVPIFEGVRL